MKIILRNIILCLFLSMTLISCGQSKPDGAGVAESFVKNYYKFMNQAEAIKLTDMGAKDKLGKELELVTEARAKAPQQLDETRSKIGYKLSDSKFEGNMGFLTFTLSIVPNGGQGFDRNALITVQKINDSWKVIDYEETN